MFEQCRKEYEQTSRNKLAKYNLSKKDKEWMKRIMRSGTFKDKISALSIYIQDNPEFTLTTLQNLQKMMENRNKKDSL